MAFGKRAPAPQRPAPAPLPIHCKSCGRAFGTIDAPGPEVFGAMLAGTPFESLAAMVPPNVAQLLTQRLTFACAECFNTGATDGGPEQQQP